VNYVFTPDSYLQDAVKFQADSSTLLVPRVLTAKRVYPVAQKNFPGQAKQNLKLSWGKEYTVGDDTVRAPITMELYFSRRADTAEADVTLVRNLMSLLIVDSELDGYFNSLSL
jgi:hypothetical protein